VSAPFGSVPVAGRLRGQKVFLSASVPSPAAAQRYRRGEDTHLDIGEAVVGLARAVFVEDGVLVFGGHPAISPLVAMVAGEYISPRLVEGGGGEVQAPIQIYQSRAFEDYLPDETLMMFRAGYATLHWTEAVGGERFDPTVPRDRPRCPRSLRHMRERMIGETSPLAMVCIGGMEGVEQEVEVFQELRPGAPIYVFGETGGAAALLAERGGAAKEAAERGGEGILRVIDREVLAQVEPLRRSRAQRRGTPTSGVQGQPERSPVPYPLVAQILVGQLIHRDGPGDPSDPGDRRRR
jgi:hypothetical protein